MSGYARDLATLEPWEASLARSRARRRRAAGRSAGRGRAATLATLSPVSLAALLDARREARDLSAHEPWELSLGRSRARRRAAQLRFVPASSRARRLSLGALVALSAAPASLLLESGGTSLAGAAPAEPEPAVTTTTHHLVLSTGSEGRQVRLLQLALGIRADGVYGPRTEAAVRRFQASRGLAVDGVVGPATSHALAVQAPPVLSGAAVLRDLDGEVREPAPGDVSETALGSAAPATGGDGGSSGATGAEASEAGPAASSAGSGTAGAGTVSLADDASGAGASAGETGGTTLPPNRKSPVGSRLRSSSKAPGGPSRPRKAPGRAKAPLKPRVGPKARVPAKPKAPRLRRRPPKSKSRTPKASPRKPVRTPNRSLRQPKCTPCGACRPRWVSPSTANSDPTPRSLCATSRHATGLRSTASPAPPRGTRSASTACPS